jgi:hypothetical protein
MLTKLRARASYANVVATLALFLALGGSSYAALTITGRNVANRSLTAKDVKRNSLTTTEVRDRSLRGKDFKPGALPVGAPGPMGDTGAPGPKGDTGAQGARGPSDAWVVVFKAGLADVANLQDGNYVVNAAVQWRNTSVAAVDEGCSSSFNSTGGTTTNAKFSLPAQRVPAGAVGSAAGTLTVTFTDVQGSGRLGMNCGPEAFGLMIVTKVATFH